MESLLAADGFVCVGTGGEDTLTVDGVDIHVGFLDDLLVNFREALLQQVHSFCSVLTSHCVD